MWQEHCTACDQLTWLEVVIVRGEVKTTEYCAECARED